MANQTQFRNLSFQPISHDVLKAFYEYFPVNKPEDLDDPKLGNTEDTICSCHDIKCAGHFGAIKLKYPIIHPRFISHINTLLQKTVCITYNKLKKDCTDCGPKDKPYVIKIGEKKICVDNPSGKSSDVQTERNFCLTNGTQDRHITFDLVESFRKIIINTDLNISFADYFMEYIPVMPKFLRRDFEAQGFIKLKYNDILKRVTKKTQNRKSTNENVATTELAEQINYQYVIMENYKSICFGDSSKSIVSILTGKQGLWRKNALGKRSNNTARAVIAGHPYLLLDSVQCPEGTWEHYFDKSQPLSKEDLLYDVAQPGFLYNRQPSLHQYSILGVKCIMTKNSKVFHQSPLINAPFNADFDGDEMNLYKPKTQAALNEIEENVSVNKCLKQNFDANVTFKLMQDSQLGIYKLSKWVGFSSLDNAEKESMNYKSFFLQCCAYSTKEDLYSFILTHSKKITGLSIISLAFPDGFNFTSKYYDIKNGVVMRGDFSAATMNGPNDLLNNFLFFCLHDKNDDTMYGKFISCLQRLAMHFLRNFPVTLTMKDCSPTNDEIKINKDFLDDPNVQLSQARILIKGKRATMNIPTNALDDMCISGSKGNAENIIQMKCFLGQQTVYGAQPLPLKHTDLNKFEKVGFSINSLSVGLSPAETFYHCQAGKEAIVQQGTQTKVTGALQRVMCKFLENIRTNTLSAVVDNKDRVIQFKISSANLNPVKIHTNTDPLNIEYFLNSIK